MEIDEGSVMAAAYRLGERYLLTIMKRENIKANEEATIAILNRACIPRAFVKIWKRLDLRGVTIVPGYNTDRATNKRNAERFMKRLIWTADDKQT